MLARYFCNRRYQARCHWGGGGGGGIFLFLYLFIYYFLVSSDEVSHMFFCHNSPPPPPKQMDIYLINCFFMSLKMVNWTLPLPQYGNIGGGGVFGRKMCWSPLLRNLGSPMHVLESKFSRTLFFYHT